MVIARRIEILVALLRFQNSASIGKRKISDASIAARPRSNRPLRSLFDFE
jgi:hypothetical protein